MDVRCCETKHVWSKLNETLEHCFCGLFGQVTTVLLNLTLCRQVLHCTKCPSCHTCLVIYCNPAVAVGILKFNKAPLFSCRGSGFNQSLVGAHLSFIPQLSSLY